MIQLEDTNNPNHSNVDYASTTMGLVQNDKTKWFAFTHKNSNAPRNVQEVFVHPDVERIEEDAFENCKSLTRIYIPGDSILQSIGESAFWDCSSIKSIKIPDTVNKIGYRCFFHCTNLVSVSLPRANAPNGEFFGTGLTIIEPETFIECKSLQSIAIPDSVMEIGRKSFKNCSSLISVSISQTNSQISEIGKEAFCGCTSLTSFAIPPLVRHIQDRTFLNCKSLLSVIVPHRTLQSIGKCAFGGCISLLEVYNMPSLSECYTTTADAGNQQRQQIQFHQQPLVHISQNSFFNCPMLEQSGQANSGSWQGRSLDHLPIHSYLHNDFFQNDTTSAAAYSYESTLLQVVQEYPRSSLYLTDVAQMTPLHMICCHPNVTLRMIEIMKGTYSNCDDDDDLRTHEYTGRNTNLLSMKNVMGMTPLMIYLATRGIYVTCDGNNKNYNDDTPTTLLDLLKAGVQRKELEFIFEAFDDNRFLKSSLTKEFQLEDHGTSESSVSTSKLFPFMVAAVLPQYGLDVVYMLARRCPEGLRLQT